MNTLDKIKDNYINNLLKNHNNVDDSNQKNLLSKEDYEKLLEPVYQIIKNNPDLSVEELRELIYMSSGLDDLVKDFVYNKGLTPSLSISYGTKNYRETLSIGDVNKDVKASSNTLYDIASVTKLFTSISILKLYSFGIIDLNDKITKYLPDFKYLKDVSIYDLLTFRVPLLTEQRIDKAQSSDDAFDILKNIKVNEDFDYNKNLYTDMGAMVLKYVIEKVTNMGLYEFVYQNILKPSKMNDTHIIIPSNKLIRTASTNNIGYYYNDGNYVIRNNVDIGKVNDEKAQILGQERGELSGHAGLFSTSYDMSNLALAMISGDILDKEIINNMSKNVTGKKLGDNLYRQYLGMLCYSKNPILSNSEVYHPLSGKALGLGGWTGTQITLDPLNELYFFMGSNRTNNRMAFIGKERKNELITDEKGKSSIILPNGEEFIDSTRFAWDRDSFVVHPALMLSVGYDFLEKVYSIKEYDFTEKERII